MLLWLLWVPHAVQPPAKPRPDPMCQRRSASGAFSRSPGGKGAKGVPLPRNSRGCGRSRMHKKPCTESVVARRTYESTSTLYRPASAIISCRRALARRCTSKTSICTKGLSKSNRRDINYTQCAYHFALAARNSAIDNGSEVASVSCVGNTRCWTSRRPIEPWWTTSRPLPVRGLGVTHTFRY